MLHAACCILPMTCTLWSWVLGVPRYCEASRILLHLLLEVFLVGLRAVVELAKLARCQPFAHSDFLLLFTLFRHCNAIMALIVRLDLDPFLHQVLLSGSIVSKLLVGVVGVTELLQALPHKDLAHGDRLNQSNMMGGTGYTASSHKIQNLEEQSPDSQMKKVMLSRIDQ